MLGYKKFMKGGEDDMDYESKEALGKILDRLDKIDSRLDKMDSRLDKIDNRLDIMEIRQNKMAEQITELQLAQKVFELNANKKFTRLQDGMDAVEEILRMNELIR